MSTSDPPPSDPNPPAVEPDAEDREAILARRAFFIAGAVAGLTMTACEPRADPVPCLSVAVLDAGSGNEIADAGEQVAIDGGDAADGGAPAPGGGDAGAGNAPSDAGPSDAGIPPLLPVDGSVGDGGKPLPQPCLRMIPPKTPPKPCLSVKPPDTK